jgi:hypothetical protein
MASNRPPVQEGLVVSKESDDATVKFMLAEYQDLYQNVIHLENKLFSHLSFYTTLFIGIITASIAILRLSENVSSPVGKPTILAMLLVLFLIFFVVSRFELRMTTELRIRKMKFIEGITQIRQFFVDRNGVVAEYLILPVGLCKSPPYMRVKSKDWYQVLYISLLNGIAAWIVWTLLCATSYLLIVDLRQGPVSFASVLPVLLIGILVFWVVSYKMSYRNVMDECNFYDSERRQRMGGLSEYDLLERPLPESRWKWSFGDWMRWFEKRRQPTNEE